MLCGFYSNQLCTNVICLDLDLVLDISVCKYRVVWFSPVIWITQTKLIKKERPNFVFIQGLLVWPYQLNGDCKNTTVTKYLKSYKECVSLFVFSFQLPKTFQLSTQPKKFLLVESNICFLNKGTITEPTCFIGVLPLCNDLFLKFSFFTHVLLKNHYS